MIISRAEYTNLDIREDARAFPWAIYPLGDPRPWRMHPRSLSGTLPSGGPFVPEADPLQAPYQHAPKSAPIAPPKWQQQGAHESTSLANHPVISDDFVDQQQCGSDANMGAMNEDPSGLTAPMVEYDLAAPQGQDQYVSMVPGPHSARTSRSMVPIKQPAVRSNTQPMMMSRFPMAGGEPNGAMNTQAVDLAWEMIRQERKLHKNWREILDAFERVMPRFGSIDPRLIERGKPMIVSLSTITSAHEALVRSVAGVASASQLLDPNVWCQSINGIALLGSAQIHMNYKEFADGFAFVQMQYAQLLQACSARCVLQPRTFFTARVL